MKQTAVLSPFRIDDEFDFVACASSGFSRFNSSTLISAPLPATVRQYADHFKVEKKQHHALRRIYIHGTNRSIAY
jgi:hypothetical protein